MTDVMEQEVATKTRKTPEPLTPEQKQAATLRREGTLLAKYGQDAKAQELFAQADQIAPQRAVQSRVDPLAQLSTEEQHYLRVTYFETTKQGFARIAAMVSYKKLAAIVESNGK